MGEIVLALHDQSVSLSYPDMLQDDIASLFGAAVAANFPARRTIEISVGADGLFTLDAEDEPLLERLSRGEMLIHLQDAVVHALVVDAAQAVALHTGAVSHGDRAILIAGPTGSGKTTLTGWLVGKGFGYLTDEVVVLTDHASKVVGFPRAMVVKGGRDDGPAPAPEFEAAAAVEAGERLMIRPAKQVDAAAGRACGLIIFPVYSADAALRIAPLTAAQAGMRLMECNLNARNLADEGFRAVTTLARRAPAFVLHYGDLSQLDGVVDTLARLVLDGLDDAAAARRFLAGYAGGEAAVPRPTPVPKTFEILPATPRRERRQLTIGMATYDDYDGVYFTLQALRLYHPEILDRTNFLVIDNHPDGPCAAPLKQLDTMAPNYRYVPAVKLTGTTIRNMVFEEADSDFVLCLDCHVLVQPGAIARLLGYFDEHPDTRDLLQGPLVYDNLDSWSPQFKPGWRSGMYGSWEPDPRADDPDGEPFDIPMQGLGLFACRRDAWLGFNPSFRGFGGEEGYIHQKFRNAGARTLCLPFLRWVHRFNRPLGVPYPNRWDDRIRNYLIGFREVGLPTEPMVEHFRELLGKDTADRLLAAAEADIAGDLD